MEQLALLGVRLRAAATFEQFEAGPNAAVVAACEARAKEVGLAPAFIWGVGRSGRTHLLQAICARATLSGRHVAYLPLGESWCQPDMLLGLEKLDVVCLDDVDARVVQRFVGGEWQPRDDRRVRPGRPDGRTAGSRFASGSLPDLASSYVG